MAISYRVFLTSIIGLWLPFIFLHAPPPLFAREGCLDEYQVPGVENGYSKQVILKSKMILEYKD